MIRTFKNETGSPEVKIRRESPVIGGARFYPGTSISFTEAQWENVSQIDKNYLLSLTSMGGFTLIETAFLPDSGPVPSKPVKPVEPVKEEKPAEPEVSESKEEVSESDQESGKDAVDDGKSDETTEADGKNDETTESEPGGSDDVKDSEVVEGKPNENENSDTINEAGSESGSGGGSNDVSDSEPDKSEETVEVIDDFNYNEFLDRSISKVKSAFKELPEADRPSIEKLMAAEKAGDNRSGLIGWLTELSS